MTTQTIIKEGLLAANGLKLHYSEAGDGNPLIVFPAHNTEPFDALAKQLAESNRVISLNLPNAPNAASTLSADELSPAIKRLGFERYSVMGTSDGAADALAQAIATPGDIDKLILLAPARLFGSANEPRGLDRVTAATLILVGTRDTSGAAEAGRLCREKIRSCHLSFVYGAGPNVAADRLEACFRTINDFLEEGEQFIICRESQMLRP